MYIHNQSDKSSALLSTNQIVKSAYYNNFIESLDGNEIMAHKTPSM